ncbi:MAG TPA: MauE/DoxX family redox-associated membrane protein [Candidatus Limnocylindrales bacterium]
MLTSIAAAQPLILAVVLGWAGGYKLKQRTSLTYRVVGAVELIAAASLLAPPALPWEPWLGVTLAAGFLFYLGFTRLTAPTASCGCLSSSDSSPIGWRHFGRAGLLLLSAVSIAVLGHGHPITTVAIGVLAVELAAVLALSPEFDYVLPRMYGRVRQRLFPHPFAETAALPRIPLHATLEQLYDSPIYAANAGLLRSDVQDYWDVGEWRILTFGGRAGRTEEAMTVVFAVPAGAGEGIRMSVVDNRTERV